MSMQRGVGVCGCLFVDRGYDGLHLGLCNSSLFWFLLSFPVLSFFLEFHLFLPRMVEWVLLMCKIAGFGGVGGLMQF